VHRAEKVLGGGFEWQRRLKVLRRFGRPTQTANNQQLPHPGQAEDSGPGSWQQAGIIFTEKHTKVTKCTKANLF